MCTFVGVKTLSRGSKEETLLRGLASQIEKSGIRVRREKLARGAAFRAKSGNCKFGADDLLFVDRRLPEDQQLSLLVDYVVENNIPLDQEVSSLLPDNYRRLIPETTP